MHGTGVYSCISSDHHCKKIPGGHMAKVQLHNHDSLGHCPALEQRLPKQVV